MTEKTSTPILTPEQEESLLEIQAENTAHVPFEKEQNPFEEKEKEESATEKNMTSSVLNRVMAMDEKKNKAMDSKSALAFLSSLGFYIATPTVLGAFVGSWLDKRHPNSEMSWSLNLILFGVIVGVFSASQWLKREAIDGAFKRERKLKTVREALKKKLEEKHADKEVSSDDDV